jgi:hypothetical protein
MQTNAAEVQRVSSIATDILHSLREHQNELTFWSLQDIVLLLSKGYNREQIVAGFTRPVFAD